MQKYAIETNCAVNVASIQETDWGTQRIGDLGRVITGKTPTTKDPRNFGGEYPFITIPDLDGRVYVDESARTLSQQGADKIKTSLLPTGSVMMSCIATVGKCGITAKPSFTNQQINSVIPGDRVDPRFLYYVFTQLGTELQSAGGGGSVYINVSKSRFSDVEVALPRLSEQRRIAHVLGTLDDKIELNRRVNETLEEMARAIFKDWFVDFGPVRAKMEGRDAYLPEEIWRLFPDRLVESELGEVPEGWGVKRLGEVCEINPRRSLKKGAVAPYLAMSNMPTKGHSPVNVVDRPFGSGMRYKNGDTLVARITPCLENGKTAYVDFLNDGQIGWGSTEYIVMRPDPPIPTWFAYCLARGGDFRDFAVHNMSGTSGRQRVSGDAISSYRLAVPVELGIPEAFGRLVEQLFVQAFQNSRQSRTLVDHRDAMLPRLVSGKVKTQDTDKMVKHE